MRILNTAPPLYPKSIHVSMRRTEKYVISNFELCPPRGGLGVCNLWPACSMQALRRHGLVSKEGRHLCLNDFPQGISIFTITREIPYLKCLSFVRQEGDWAFVVCGLSVACLLWPNLKYVLLGLVAQRWVLLLATQLSEESAGSVPGPQKTGFGHNFLPRWN